MRIEFNKEPLPIPKGKSGELSREVLKLIHSQGLTYLETKKALDFVDQALLDKLLNSKKI